MEAAVLTTFTTRGAQGVIDIGFGHSLILLAVVFATMWLRGAEQFKSCRCVLL